MKKFAIAAIAVLSIAGSGVVYAQYHQFSEHMQHMRMNPEDRAAFVDARIAAVHAGLKLNATRRSCGRRSRPPCAISPSSASTAPTRG